MEKPNVDKKKIHYFIEGGIIAALYAVLTYTLAPLSYGPVQVRISEALCILPFFTPSAVPGLFVGCVIANLFSPFGWIDVALGSAATLLAAFLASRIRVKGLVPLPAVLINAVAIGAEISILSIGTVEQVSFLAAAGYIALGQTAACYVLGLPLLFLLERYKNQIFQIKVTMKNICVFASSSKIIDPQYFEKTRELAALIAEKGWGAVFGGGMAGLMGALADGMIEHGGTIAGVIPELLNVKNVVHEGCSEMVVTATLRERKKIMEERADAFIALPGGFGTLEELLEIITLKQLKYHLKPVVVMNFLHYYDSLRELFDHVIREKFAIADSRSLYYFTEDPRDAIDYIENYHFEGISPKWQP